MSAPVLPRIAVLMATHNGAEWIGAQVRSILDQTDVAVQIFLSDDGSDDDTVDLARDMAGDRLTVLPETRSGSAAGNFMRLIADADWAGYDHVALADQDDVWHPGKLARAVAALAQNGAAAYSSDVVAVWPDGRRHEIRKSQPQRRWDHLFESGGPGCTFVFPVAEADWLRARLAAANPEALSRVAFHDWLFYALFRAAGKDWMIDRYIGMEYRQHGANAHGAAPGAAARARRARMVRGGWYREQVLLIAGLAGAENPVLNYIAQPRITRVWVPVVHARACRRRTLDAVLFAGALAAMAGRRH